MLKRVGLIAAAASVAALAIVASAIARPATVRSGVGAFVQEGRLDRHARPDHGPRRLDRQRPAALGGVLRHPVEQEQEAREDQARPGRHAARSGEGFDGRAVVRLERSILGVIGPAGSDEVQAVAPILRKAGLAFASGSATRVSLTNGSWKGYFFRDVPNDGVQGPTAANFMFTEARPQVRRLGDGRRRPGVLLDGPRRHRRPEPVRQGRQGRPRVDQPEGDRLLVAHREGDVEHEGRLPAVPARFAGSALRSAAQGAGQDRDRVRQ